MSRIALVDPASAEGKAKEIMDGLVQRTGTVYNIYKGMANAPAVLEGFMALSGGMGKASLPAKIREQIALLVAEENGCNYCLAAHTAAGKKAGLTEAETLQSRLGKGTDPKADAILKFVNHMIDKLGHVSDDDVAALRQAGVNDQEIVEVVGCVCLNLFTNYFNHVVDTPPDFPDAPPLPL